MHVNRPVIATMLALTGTAVAVTALGAANLTGVTSAAAHEDDGSGRGESRDRNVSVEVLAPEGGDSAGVAGAGWFVDLELEFPVAPGTPARGLHRPAADRTGRPCQHRAVPWDVLHRSR